jgi:hypothetical protein
MSSKFIHVAYDKISSFGKTIIPLYVCATVLKICSCVDGDLGCLHLLPIVNDASVNRDLQIPFCDAVFNSF